MDGGYKMILSWSGMECQILSVSPCMRTLSGDLPIIIPAAFNYPYLVICLPKHIEVRDVRQGKAVQVIQGDNFRCLFEDNEPSKTPSGTYPRENKPVVMVSDSQVVLLQRESPPPESEAKNGQDAGAPANT